MTDYKDLQKRCQRGATNLNDANNLLAECYGVMGKLGAENAALRKVALELRDSAACENVLHYPRDSHNWDQPCPVLERIDAALTSAMSKEG